MATPASDEKLQELLDELELISSALSTVNTRLDAIENDIESTNVMLDTINTNLTTVITNQGTIESIIEENGSKLNSIESNTESTKSSLSQILVNSNSVSVPKAGILINEFTGKEDLDNDGKIYGRDFMIDASAPNFPPMLAGIHDSADWEDPDEILTWYQYLNPYTSTCTIVSSATALLNVT